MFISPISGLFNPLSCLGLIIEYFLDLRLFCHHVLRVKAIGITLPSELLCAGKMGARCYLLCLRCHAGPGSVSVCRPSSVTAWSVMNGTSGLWLMLGVDCEVWFAH